MSTLIAPPPDAETLRQALALLEPWRVLHAPRTLHAERIPATGPALLVGNHTLFGLIDSPLLLAEVYRAVGRWPRALADHAHFKIPAWRTFVERFGAVDGRREACLSLFAQGELVLVFPGGAREVCKRRGEEYQLVWGQRTGFVRVAQEAGVPLVPFAAVGVEDAFRVVADGEDLLRTPLGAALAEGGVRKDLLFPLVAPTGKTVDLWFWFGEPILPRPEEDPLMVQEQVRDAIQVGLDQLFAAREERPHPPVWWRVAYGALDRLSRWAPSSAPPAADLAEGWPAGED